MPCILTKKMGLSSWSSSGTCVFNLGEVALSLRRPPIYLSKWFSYELGCATSYPYLNDVGRSRITGHQNQSVIENSLNKFIEKYVLCPRCGLPEMDMCVEQGAVKGKCKACGHKVELGDGHKIQNFITTHPPEVFAYPARAIEVSHNADLIAGKNLAGDELFCIAGGSESRNVGKIRHRIAVTLRTCPSNLTVFEGDRHLCDIDSINSTNFCVKQEIPTLLTTGLTKARERTRQRQTRARQASTNSTSSSSTSSSSASSSSTSSSSSDD